MGAGCVRREGVWVGGVWGRGCGVHVGVLLRDQKVLLSRVALWGQGGGGGCGREGWAGGEARVGGDAGAGRRVGRVGGGGVGWSGGAVGSGSAGGADLLEVSTRSSMYESLNTVSSSSSGVASSIGWMTLSHLAQHQAA